MDRCLFSTYVYDEQLFDTPSIVNSSHFHEKIPATRNLAWAVCMPRSFGFIRYGASPGARSVLAHLNLTTLSF